LRHFHRSVGRFTEGDATGLTCKAFDLGVTLFDAADTYGNSLRKVSDLLRSKIAKPLRAGEFSLSAVKMGGTFRAQ
jgi:aryl-alcohol dehydrogenase-like predicted oxidoreductase